MERKIPFRCDKISVCSSHRHLIVSRVLIRSIVKSGDSIASNSCAGFKSVVLNGTTYDLRRVTVNRKPDLLRIKNYTQTFRIRIKIYMCGSTVFLTFPIFFFFVARANCGNLLDKYLIGFNFVCIQSTYLLRERIDQISILSVYYSIRLRSGI